MFLNCDPDLEIFLCQYNTDDPNLYKQKKSKPFFINKTQLQAKMVYILFGKLVVSLLHRGGEKSFKQINVFSSSAKNVA